jgi:hypothetical protein
VQDFFAKGVDFSLSLWYNISVKERNEVSTMRYFIYDKIEKKDKEITLHNLTELIWKISWSGNEVVQIYKATETEMYFIVKKV